MPMKPGSSAYETRFQYGWNGNISIRLRQRPTKLIFNFGGKGLPLPHPNKPLKKKEV